MNSNEPGPGHVHCWQAVTDHQGEIVLLQCAFCTATKPPG